VAIKRRRSKFLVMLAAGVVAVLAFGLWFVVLRDDAPPPAALAHRTIEPAAEASARDLGGTWTVAPGPDVWAGYRITEHVGVVDNVAVARTGHVTGELTVRGTHISEVTAEVAMDTLVSKDTELPGVGHRADAMRTKGLETDRYPNASFTLAKPIDLGKLPNAGTAIEARAVGTLDLHGVERQVTIPIEARWNGGKVIDVTGSLQVRLADFGIDPPDPKVVTVAGTGTLELQLTFTRR